MMKNLKLLGIIIVLIASLGDGVQAQEMVINGGFEAVAPAVINPYPPLFDFFDWDILPFPWQMRNSCDYSVTTVGSISGLANSGLGSARFAATASNGNTTNPYREIPIGQTLPLTGGTQYKIEFWVKRFTSGINIEIGAVMTTVAVPCTSAPCLFPAGITPDASGVITTNNHQYTKIVGNWTAPVSGIYYINIGNFNVTNVEGFEDNLFYLDDVSIKPCTGTGAPNPIIALGNLFCEADPIIADASSSTNIDCYRWELWPQNGGSLINSSQWFLGNPGQFDVRTLATLTKGNCYQLKLSTREGCALQTAISDFCIENPNVNLSATGQNPYCEGDALNITATGDNGWTYTWSTNQSGIGLQTISPIADINTSSYSVTVTTSSGCTATSNINNLVIHTNNNQAPTTNGVNGSGNFTFYARANAGFACFSIPSFDAANEVVIMSSTLPPNNPPIFAHNYTGSPHQTGNICWFPTTPDVGSHPFAVTVTDQNACASKTTTDIYRINVICEFCPLDLFIQNRRPNNNPLPALTEAGRKIVAGSNVDNTQPAGTVETGNSSVVFESSAIDLNPGFTAGANFTAQINPTTCTSNCSSCCDNFNGFTVSLIPNAFTPNGDGINDFWQPIDLQNPFCAFGAQEFNLVIVTPSGSQIYSLSGGQPGLCCPFESRAPGNNIPYGSIFWDGKTNQSIFGFPAGTPVPDGTYFFVLELKGCGTSQVFSSFITVLGSTAKISNNDSITNLPMEFVMLDKENLSIFETKEEIDSITATKRITNETNSELVVYPNPTKNVINLVLTNSASVQNGVVEVYSLQGKLLNTTIMNSTNTSIDATLYAKGAYFIKLTVDNNIYKQTFIKE
jgi:Secretion system C-terminal sorting domain/CHU_C Type IX secretion signal domain